MPATFDATQFGIMLRLFVRQKLRSLPAVGQADAAKILALLEQHASGVVDDIQSTLESEFLRSDPAVLAGLPTLAGLKQWLDTNWMNVASVLAAYASGGDVVASASSSSDNQTPPAEVSSPAAASAAPAATAPANPPAPAAAAAVAPTTTATPAAPAAPAPAASPTPATSA